MQRITPDRPWPLHDLAQTRLIEQAAAAALPPHTLMQRAGLRVAQLALAVAPHARSIWIACGPGNNGGDGIEAALHLKRWGKHAVVTWLGSEDRAPADTLASLARARAEGVVFSDAPPPAPDLCIDALLGLGAARAPDGRLAEWISLLNAGNAPVLCVDLPSGLDADTGKHQGLCVRARHTLALVALKPGLFTGQGRDSAGSIWFDSLETSAHGVGKAAAWLQGPPEMAARLHASHKGSYGDVAVIGGASGMAGAALLAATAALHAGAGRVFAALLDGSAGLDPSQPELMLRPVESLDLRGMAIACGCGGGDAVRAVLPRVCSTAKSLVLDADALNALAQDTQLQALVQARAGRDLPTVLTPHPLEAARLLGSTTAQVQADRLAAAAGLARRFRCIAVLKGSGTVIAAPGETSVINPSGNARLATAGTGDVLAGMIAAALAAAGDGATPFQAACHAVYSHGCIANRWPGGTALTAGALARAVTP